MHRVKDAVRGCLVGTAVGDALGMPSEGMTRTDIANIFGYIDGYRDSNSKFSRELKKGQWTDDTKLALATAEGIIDGLAKNSVFNANVIKSAILVIYIEAYMEHQNRGFGRTTRESLKARIEGREPFGPEQVSRPGNGCAMKNAIIGIFSALMIYFGVSCSEEDEENFEIDISLLTHNDSRSIVAGLLQAEIAWFLFFGWHLNNETNFSWIVKKAKYYEEKVLKNSLVKDGSPKVSEKIALIPDVIKGSDEMIADILKTSGAAFESFPTALAFAAKYQNDFRKAVLAGANAGGDTDTIAAMSGALVGTRLGFSSIPEEWLAELENKDYIVSVADKLIEAVARLN